MNIDQALIALCRKHDLTRVEVSGCIPEWDGGGQFFAASGFWRDSGGNLNCRHANGPTASEAIAHAIQQVNEARACVVEVPAMELEA